MDVTFPKDGFVERQSGARVFTTFKITGCARSLSFSNAEEIRAGSHDEISSAI
jgi:hypothetical protein